MRCSKCGADNREGARFCDKCGGKFSLRCASCGAENRTTAKFCDSCGTAFGADGTLAAPAVKMNDTPIRVTETFAAENLEGERKTVTALFADIKGSMDLIEDLDPEEARAIVDPALKLMIAVVHHYDGYVAQPTGDGIFALFGAPVAHEDHPQRALLTALRIQRELKRYSHPKRAGGGLPIQVRVGVNIGEVVVREIKTREAHSEYAPIGHSISLAARMQTLAPIGSIATTEAVRKLCEGYFLFKSLGRSKVKGVSEPVDIYEVTGVGPLRTRLQRSASRGYTKFVGRQREMDAIEHGAALAKSGHGQIVAIVAEPGVGKSRLLFEFRVKNQSGWMVLEAVSASHDKATAYLPLIELLYSYFGIESDDDSGHRRKKVSSKMATLDRSLEQDTLPHLFALLGIVDGESPLAQMDAQIRLRRTQEAVKRILVRESLNQPLMLIFEDLHWIDEETRGFLNLLAEGMGNSPILLLVNYRPEYSHQWNSKTYYTQIRLDPLGKESSEEMLSTLVGDGTDLAALKRIIIDKTEGNPLFMEEIFQALVEDGSLQRNGAVTLARPVELLKLPPTVQGILASRIDRLPPERKDLLQMLAVIGMQFPLSLVREIVPVRPDRLDHLLTDLQTREFIYEQAGASDLVYTFKHALTRDVAYESVLTARRGHLHERAGLAIEILFAKSLDDHLSELAYHFTHTANSSKAAHYLALLGKQSLEQAAIGESLTSLQQGLERVTRIGDRTERAKLELSLQLALFSALSYFKSPASPEAAEALHRAEELCDLVGTDAERFSILMRLRHALLFGGKQEAAIEKCWSALNLAERLGDPEMLAGASAIAASTIVTAGRLVEALQLARRAIGTAESADLQRNISFIRVESLAAITAANALALLGYPDQAEKAVREKLVAAEQRGDVTSYFVTAALASFVYFLIRIPDRVRDLLQPFLIAAEQAGVIYERARAATFLGWATARLGNPEQGITMIRSARADIRAVGAIEFAYTLPDALLSAARYEEAITEVDEALAELGPRPYYLASELYRIKGEAILGHDRAATSQAGGCFRTAIAIARNQESRWQELRATVSLTRLLSDNNRRDEARTMLTAVYNWFTEGFDTADLKEAKALCEELSNSP